MSEDIGELVLQPLTRTVSSPEGEATSGPATYLGTDWGPEGAGRWHSLAGLMEEDGICLDLARCYPFVRAEYQPCCVGAIVEARGAGTLKMELRSADARVLWWATRELALGEQWQELAFAWQPAGLRKVKSLHWSAEPGADLEVGSLDLQIRMPRLPFEQELLLLSYAKLARLYSEDQGLVRERAPQLPGRRDSVTGSGLFCLATCAASRAGLLKQAQAEQILHKVHATVCDLPRAKGLIPDVVRARGEKYVLADGAEYRSLDTSLYYHSMLLAAQLLWDGKTLAGLVKAVREVDFDRLRDPEGFVSMGMKADGRTPLDASWRRWGGESVLVLLLEHMATGDIRQPKLDGAGKVPDGVGLSAEIQSLFYADFSVGEEDQVTGVDWRAARRAHLRKQKAFVRRRARGSAAARLALYGLSVGEDPSGRGFAASGVRRGSKTDLLRPHYMLMSGLVEPDPATVYDSLRALRENALIPPWGMVGGFTKDLEHAPMHGWLSAGLECIAAYHLWTRVAGQPDHIYEGVEDCGLLREAIRVFYPPTKTW